MDHTSNPNGLVQGRVLILDDDPDVGRIFAIVAKQIGMEAEAVTSSDEFFTKLAAWCPTHIVLDLIMPDMDGVQVIQRLAELDSDAALCLTSGAGPRVLKAARQSAIEHGFCTPQILLKPVSLEQIEAFLRDPIAGPKTRPNRVANGKVQILGHDIQRGMQEEEFFLSYQPVITCPKRKLKGFEALIRWQHPVHGLVMPDSFIGVAESTGLIHDLTNQVVAMSLKWLGSSPVLHRKTLSINVSAKSLDDKEFPDRLGAAARSAGISPSDVILEVTETAAASDELLALDLFTRLRVKGFKVSIDDFGIGTSSLSLLARLPFSEIKVDRSFAMASQESEEARAIIRSTVDLSRNLNLDVVTEGVENKATLDYLDVVGCDFAQGYYIARPMTGEQAIDWATTSPYAN